MTGWLCDLQSHPPLQNICDNLVRDFFVLPGVTVASVKQLMPSVNSRLCIFFPKMKFHTVPKMLLIGVKLISMKDHNSNI